MQHFYPLHFTKKFLIQYSIQIRRNCYSTQLKPICDIVYFLSNMKLFSSPISVYLDAYKSLTWRIQIWTLKKAEI